MLKKLVSERLHVPEEQQHLLFRGQLLADDKRLSDSRIGPNASVSVDTEAVLQRLRREHEERLQRISLGDLEQLARHLLTKEPLAEPAGERKPEALSPDKEEEKEAAQ
ncbi:hypothetical protein R6Z07F_000645 [Ovis aries]